MNKFCNPQGGLGWSILKAALYGCGEDGQNNPRSTADALVGITSTTFYRWYNDWLSFHLLPCDIQGKWERKSNNQWDDGADNALKNIVDNCPVLYLDEMATELKAAVGKKFSCSEISKRLRRKLGYSRKLVYEKSSQAIQSDKDNFVEAIKLYITKPEMAIFVDESNKDRKAARRKYGWSPVQLRNQR